ncbi:MAG: A24 family peptidase [Chloroflexota bacterium]|nr:A24 family peptidase [Chloroflexota bacterium]
MHWLLVALIGLLMGGVVNVLADDLPAGRRPSMPKYTNGRRRPLAAWLGLTAFAFRLRQSYDTRFADSGTDCAKRGTLSWRYPLVEIALAALMTLTQAVAIDVRSLSVPEALIWQAMVVLFLLIAVIDLEHRRIPLTPLLAAGALAVIRAFAIPLRPPTTAAMLVGALCAGLAFSLVYLGGRLFARLASKRWSLPKDVTAFGRGDVYLMTAGGLILGYPDVLIAMALAILLGGIGALFYMAGKRASGGYQPFTALPYGPYILAAIYVVMLLPGEASGLFAGL